jgi:L-serine/L-threonine ammonia-lyase
MIPLHYETPLLESLSLEKKIDIPVFLKIESMQPSGSFKNRGIGLFCQRAAHEGAKHFVISSGGNAGLAVAYSGYRLGVPVTVIIPETAPAFMSEKIKREQAEVIVKGADFQESDKLARELSEKPGFVYVSPFDHPHIWEGHASIIHEVAKKGKKPGAVLLSVGGGGLLCGVIQGLHEVGWGDVPVVTVETEGAASFAKSVQAQKIITLDRISTIATSIGARRIADKAFELGQHHIIYPQIVSDRDTLDACFNFLDDERLLVEPACGVALVPIYQKHEYLKNFSSLLVIVCGGNVVSLELLNKWNKLLNP